MKKHILKHPTQLLFVFFLIFLIGACATMQKMDPRNVKAPEFKKEPPVPKISSFDSALRNLGKMTEIYGTPVINLQSKDIADNTGTSAATKGEIPRDITEMVKTSLNAIGGNVVFIPYNPSYMQNNMVTGYSNFSNKFIPDVVVTGGITEFDRGLETRGKGMDIGGETSTFGLENVVGVDYGQGQKESLASITLDFNLLDFQAMAGIARMQTVNTIKVQKAVAEKELAFTLFGPTFGLKGNIKKVQGRHAAVRMLVQLSMVQIVGKYLALPYWQLLPNAEPDPVVLDAVTKFFYASDETNKIAKIQELLFLHGYDVDLSNVLDQKTKLALQRYSPDYDLNSHTVDKDTFLSLYLNIPLEDINLARRNTITRIREQQRLEALRWQQEQQAEALRKKQQQEAAELRKKQQQEAAALRKKQEQESAIRKKQEQKAVLERKKAAEQRKKKAMQDLIKFTETKERGVTESSQPSEEW